MRRLIALFALALVGAAPAGRPIFADAMENAGHWPAKSSDSVTASINSVPGASGHAIELRYDYGRVSGYAYIRRAVAVELPRNFEVRFKMRGSGGRNDLQLKLTQGDNVWWKVWRNERPSSEWQEVVVPAGEIGFAWGPAGDKSLRRIDGLEFVVARNRDGGAGRTVIDELRIVPLPGEPALARPPENSATDRITALAKASPRGHFPRAFIGEQPYWTLAGSDGGAVTALISEDAAVEPAKGSYSIEPVVIDGGTRFHWANVAQRQSLDEASCQFRPLTGAPVGSNSRRPCLPTAQGGQCSPATS